MLTVGIAIGITERFADGYVVEGKLTWQVINKLGAILEVLLGVVLADHSIGKHAAHRHVWRSCLR